MKTEALREISGERRAGALQRRQGDKEEEEEAEGMQKGRKGGRKEGIVTEDEDRSTERNIRERLAVALQRRRRRRRGEGGGGRMNEGRKEGRKKSKE